MSDNEKPSLQEIVTRWSADLENGKMPHHDDDKKREFLVLLKTLKDFGYTSKDVVGNTAERYLMEECCPNGTRNKVKNFKGWYDRTWGLWKKTASKFYDEVKLAIVTDEDVAALSTPEKVRAPQQPKQAAKKPDIQKVESEPANKSSDLLDRSLFKDVPKPKPVFDLDFMRECGIDPTEFGVGEDE